MMVNTVLELADVDPALHQLATQKLNSIPKAFVDNSLSMLGLAA